MPQPTIRSVAYSERLLRPSRLPVGTRQILDATQPPSRVLHDLSPPRQPQFKKQRSFSPVEVDMASSSTTDAQYLAATRLERQAKRIADAEAALANPPPPQPAEKQRHRGRGKQWKAFDFTTDSVAPDNFGGGVPISRVNVFRAPSAAEFSSRPVSRLSTLTTESATASEIDRRDSTNDDAGFRVITGKKKKSTPLDAYEGSALESKQATVEAHYNRREICEVFGNELPEPAYVQQTPGTQEGQVQFVQHPNGDVAAHQWSDALFQWQNIGQYSNIRKKAEGQLGGDGLKGESGDITLQRNTLAYFHALARQREANAMGMPFGLKQVQALMPDLQITAKATPAPKRIVASGLNAQASEYGEPPQTAVFAPRVSLPAAPRAMAEQPSSVKSTMAQRSEHSDPGLVHQGYGATQQQQTQYQPRQDDPFYDNYHPNHYYAGYSAYPQTYTSMYPQSQASQYGAAPSYTRYGAMDYNFQYPPASYQDAFVDPARASYQQYYDAQNQTSIRSVYAQSQATVEDPQKQRYNTFGNTISQQRAVPQTPRGAMPQGINRQHPATDPAPHPAANTAILASRPKLVTPSKSRAEMRQQLAGLGDKAKERSLSQANIARTVMYDPFRGHQAPEQHMVETIAPKIDPPARTEGSGRFSMLPSASPFDQTSDIYVPNLGDQHFGEPSTPTPAEDSPSNWLKNSSPDTTWESKGVTRYEIQTPPGLSARRKPRIQNFQGPFFTEQSDWLQQRLDEALSDQDRAALYDDELEDWWAGGDRFERQEQVFQRIMDVNKPPSPKGSAADIFSRAIYGDKGPPVPQVDFGPIGLGRPSTSLNSTSKAESKGIDPALTRFLIPVAQNLASYISGTEEERRPYFQNWVQPPEHCIDRSAAGNSSLFDKEDQLPRTTRFGREQSAVAPDVRFGELSSPLGGGVSVGSDEVGVVGGEKVDRFGNLGGW